MKQAFRSVVFLLAACATLLLGNCKKQNGTPPTTPGKFSFSNSEYTGTAKAGNHYYPRPISIRFNSDSTMSIFSYIILNGKYSTVAGKITQVVVAADGSTQITVSLAFPAIEQPYNSPQTFTISADKSTLSGGAFPLYAIVSMKLFPTKAPSVVGTWGSTLGYPDINQIKFFPDSCNTHIHGGQALYVDAAKTLLVTTRYHQDMSRLTFVGIEERYNNQILNYYGVLTADGNTIFADSYDFSLSRLPALAAGGGNLYGPVGVTPTIVRQ